ncbi:MAG: HipA N-terminal domain-containing protein [Chitinophagales bacterium]
MMKTIYRRGQVYVHQRFAGILEEYEDGYRFTYDSDYLQSENPVAVSLTLQLQKQPYESSTMVPFFDGLIPEGWLLDIAVNTWKIDRRDRMGLLLSVCKDCIGAVSIEPLNEII